MTKLQALYQAFYLADQDFHRELVRVYKGWAGDARYWFEHSDAGILTARERRGKAYDAYRAEVDRHRIYPSGFEG